MKIVNSSTTEKSKVSSTSYPPYLFSLIIFSFQAGDCAVKLTSPHKNRPPVLCGPTSFAAAALQVRAKIRRKLSFPAGVSSIPHNVDPDFPRCQSSVRQDFVPVTQFPATVSATLYNHLMCKEAAPPIPCCFLIWCNTFKSGVSKNSMFKNQPEATKEQERFLHVKMILNTEFRKYEMGPRKATLQREVLPSQATQQKQNPLPLWFLPS